MMIFQVAIILGYLSIGYSYTIIGLSQISAQFSGDWIRAPDPELKKLCLKPRGLFPGRTCETFMNCWDEIVAEQKCPKGLHFSPTKLVCDYPKNVNCDEKNPDLKKLCLKPRGQFPGTSCKKYVNCWDETVIEEECPGEFLFSPTKLYCDYPNDVKCKDKEPEKEIVVYQCRILTKVHIVWAPRQKVLAADMTDPLKLWKEVLPISTQQEEDKRWNYLWDLEMYNGSFLIHPTGFLPYFLEVQSGCSQTEVGLFAKGHVFSRIKENNLFILDYYPGLLKVCGKCVHVAKDEKSLKLSENCGFDKYNQFYVTETDETSVGISKYTH